MSHIERERQELSLPPTAIMHQHVARVSNEAARLKAAHRYFQRTTFRSPFRREEFEGPT